MRVTRLLAVAGSALAIAAALTACAPGPTTPNETGAATSTPTVAPTFVPGGGAADNRDYFDATLQGVLAQNEKASAVELVDALVAAGFDKASIEFTRDETAIGLEADFIIVATRMPDGQCLIGMRAARGYSSEESAPASTGNCLMGDPARVDW